MSSRHKSKTAPHKVERAALCAEATGLRRKGLRYEAIAEAMGCSVSTAFGYVADELARLQAQAAENAEQVRAVELSRMDGYLEVLHARIDAHSIELKAYAECEIGEGEQPPKMPCTKAVDSAIASALRIQERRAKLLGIDRPVQVEHEHVHRSFEIVIPPPALGPHKASAIEVDAVEIDEHGNVANEQENE